VGISVVIFDFDSTLVRAEGLDLLADVVGEALSTSERAALVARVRDLTTRAMAGRVSFAEALRERIELLRATTRDLDRALARLREVVVDGARETVLALRQRRIAVAVVSGGLRPLVEPISLALGFPREAIHCNDPVLEGGRLTGVVAGNSLSRDGGKIEVVRRLACTGTALMVGDGATDLEVRTRGAAAFFVAFTGVVERSEVVAAADRVVNRMPLILDLLDEPLLQD